MEKKSNKNNKTSPANPFYRSSEGSKWSPPSAAGSTAAKSSSLQATMAPASPPTHQEIAERAKAVWKAHGCAAGRDRENWLEAEAQLRKERGRC